MVRMPGIDMEPQVCISYAKKYAQTTFKLSNQLVVGFSVEYSPHNRLLSPIFCLSKKKGKEHTWILHLQCIILPQQDVLLNQVHLSLLQCPPVHTFRPSLPVLPRNLMTGSEGMILQQWKKYLYWRVLYQFLCSSFCCYIIIHYTQL